MSIVSCVYCIVCLVFLVFLVYLGVYRVSAMLFVSTLFAVSGVQYLTSRVSQVSAVNSYLIV